MVLTEEEQDYLAWIKMKGVQQGADQKAHEMAKKLRDSKVPIGVISEASGLTVDEIKAL